MKNTGLRPTGMYVAILAGLVGSCGGGGGSSDPADTNVDVTPDTVADDEVDVGPDVPEDTSMDPSEDTSVDEIPDVWPDAAVEVSDLTVTENPRNTLSFYATWTTDVAVPTELGVVCGADYDRTFVGTTETTSHEVFVMGLVDGVSCTVTAHPGRAGLAGTSEVVWDEVGPVPADLPALTVDVVDEGLMQPGWTLWSVAPMDVDTDVTIVIVDAQGRWRWYYNPGVDYEEPEAEVLPVEDGVVLGNLRWDSQVVGWEGEPVWTLDSRSHHDMRLSPWMDGNVLFLGHGSESCTYGGVEHTAVEMVIDTKEVVWEWWICDHWVPRVDYTGWSHLNTIEPFPGERAVLISSRNQDLLLKVNRDTDEIEWTLGLDGDFEMDPEDLFYRQHAPEIQPDGTILVFDNGLRPTEAATDGLEPRQWSRVIQIELSFDGSGAPDRADVIWDYTDASIWAISRSEADRLENGNTLIHYCYVQPDRQTILREVTSDGTIVWNVSSPPEVASYRSERFDPYWGHVLSGD